MLGGGTADNVRSFRVGSWSRHVHNPLSPRRVRPEGSPLRRLLIASTLAIVTAAGSVVAVRSGEPPAAATLAGSGGPLAAAASVGESTTPSTPTGDPTTDPTAEPVTTARAPSAVSATSPACHTAASQRYDIDRIAGSNRWATATCASQVHYPDEVDTVVLARGDVQGGFADALAGAVLARHVDGPVLLTAPDTLPTETAAELDRLAPRRVVILGGTEAISPAVERAVARRTADIERISGSDRADTAARIAATVGPRQHAFVVNGYVPADALIAATVAARDGAVLLLTNPGSVPASTTDALADVADVTVVGSFTAIGEASEATLRRRVGGDHLERLSGPDRAETAASVARAHPASGRIHLVSGNDRSLVDALSASWAAAMPGGGSVLFTGRDAPGRGTDRYLRLGHLAADTSIRLVGGEKVLSSELVTSLDRRIDEARQGGPDAQLRGFWVHLFDQSLKSRSGISEVLDAAVAANLNTIVVQAVRRHDAFYDSDVLPRTTDPKMPPGLDLLDRLIPEAHARGLDVHAWFSVMPTYHDSFTKNGERLPADHVHSRHGPNGSEASWMAAANDANYAFLDPGIPGVQDHVVATLREVVERYDVDGVHLDYLRYAAGGSRMNPIAEARYRRVGDGISLDEFRRRQTEDLARRVYLEVAEADPSVAVSMAAIAQGAGPTGSDLRASFRGTRAYADKFQDWPTWLDRGIVDMAFPMAYFQESRYPSWYDQWTRFAGSLGRGVVAVGQASYLNATSASLSQVGDALSLTDGAVLYSYQQDTETGQGPLLRALASSRFSVPAPAPDVAGKTAPTTGHILARARDGQRVTATPVGGGATATQRADATGHAGFVGLAPGRWTITAPDAAAQLVEVTAGRVARADVR
jgi:uncharacterized lipoprotein YddW (UPF0748 family)/putative cell wall-binding protein